MQLKRQILSWMMMLVFITSTTGTPIYEHICSAKDLLSISISNQSCEEDISAHSCCDEAPKQNNCCENNFSFQKYNPNGKTEQAAVKIKLQVLFKLPSFGNPFAGSSEYYAGIAKKILKQEDPRIHAPKSTWERLSFIQTYLC